ncbi:MAG: DmsC/YnfH family molybdoenzyme membrane anchor subunit [Pseudomonadota bacterium]
MHPAISVIFFTVTSGAGFGLIFLLGLGVPMPEGPTAAFLASALAIGLSVAGLVSSTFHLGHAERAWRAFSQWQSSWLSREGVLSVITLSLFGLYALIWLMTGERNGLLGFVSAAFAALTIYATAMIYAQLKTVPAWHTWLTPLCYLGFGVSSGFLLALSFGEMDRNFAVMALLINAGFWFVKDRWWRRLDSVGFSETGSDVGTATGLGKIGKVKLLEKPHSGENYLTKEMVHQIGRKHAEKLRLIAKFAGGLVPALVLIAIILFGAPGYIAVVGFFSIMVGLFAERWLFFAEAKHAVSLYY